MSILSVENVTVKFETRNGTTVAVDNVSFDVDKGEILGIVGESGSGKSVSCYSLLGLVPSPPGHIDSGQAFFQENDFIKAML